MPGGRPKAKPDGRKRPIDALVRSAETTPFHSPLAMMGVSDGSEIINLDTGEVKPTGLPGTTLNTAGRQRLVQMIIAGMTDTEIAKAIVDEGYMISYTSAAVGYWRERPEVQTALANRSRRVYQESLAAKEQRVALRIELAFALRKEILVPDPEDPTGTKMMLRRTYLDDTNPQNPVTKLVSRQTQMLVVKEYQASLEGIKEEVDDPTRDVNLNVSGNINHSATAGNVGFDLNDPDADARLTRLLAEAHDTLEGEFEIQENLPTSIGGSSNADDEPDDD